MDPYIGEVRLFPYNYIPRDWMRCDGTELQIRSNPGLFAVISTLYGGDGTNTFKLPNLNGRAAVGAGVSATGSAWPIGKPTGADTVQLTTANLPQHNHGLNVIPSVTASTAINAPASNVVPTQPTRVALYNKAADTSLSPETLAPAGSSAPMNIMQPYQTLVYCIATQGIYPSRP